MEKASDGSFARTTRKTAEDEGRRRGRGRLGQDAKQIRKGSQSDVQETDAKNLFLYGQQSLDCVLVRINFSQREIVSLPNKYQLLFGSVRSALAHAISRPFRANCFIGSFPGLKPGLKPWAESYSPCGALQFGHFETVNPGEILDFSLGKSFLLFCWPRDFVRCSDVQKWSHYIFRAAR